MSIRQPAVAGLFYPADGAELTDLVSGLLAEARALRGTGDRLAPTALIAPHAGYIYSGSTAAEGYAALAPAAGRVRRVVLLGPCHRVAIDGLAHPGVTAFATPTGLVPIEPLDPDVEAVLPQLVTSPAAHLDEHSLEVHLPFVQAVLGEVDVLPLAVGRASAPEVAAVIEAVGGGSDTVIVVSSDLSHHLSYERARAEDAATVRQILDLDGPISHHQACGATPTNGLLVTAAAHAMTAEVLGMRNSGDTAGDRRRVVGYASIGFWEAGDAIS